ncbi:MAG: thymidylate kinase [Candidatus Bathyarchaeia archaeon]
MFIVFDGLDGSGKSTQALMLCRHLEELGKSYILRTHPSTDNPFGRRSRVYLQKDGKQAQISASLFYLLDVARSILLYYWSSVDYIVFVRYLMGTAYLPEAIYNLGYLFFLMLVPHSQYMFFINTTPAEAHRRIERNRKQKEMFETPQKLQEVYRKITTLASRPEWIVLDGNRPSHEIQREVRSILDLT